MQRNQKKSTPKYREADRGSFQIYPKTFEVELNSSILDSRGAPMRTLHVIEELDEGSFSAVFQVSLCGQGNEKTNGVNRSKTYAVKALKYGFQADAEKHRAEIQCHQARSLEHEAKVLLRVNHENIIQLHGIGQFTLYNGSKAPFLMLDLLPVTLDKQIERWIREERPRPLRCLIIGSMASITNSSVSGSSESEANLTEYDQKRPRLRSVSSLSSFSDFGDHHQGDNANLLHRLKKAALGIARGLEFLHAHSIIHGDVKPPNIGFSEHGIVKLFDLNLSIQANDGSSTPLSHPVGTQRYMAPEVSMNKVCGTFSDVYSFAIILWEIIVLKRPYNYTTLNKMKRKVLNGERPSLKHVPDSLPFRPLLTSAWAPAYQDRPPMRHIRESLEEMV